MDTNKMRDISREQFEAFASAHEVLKQYGFEKFPAGGDDYDAIPLQAAWAAWQASREAVVVELPRDIDQFADDDPGRRAFSLHTNTAYRECRRAIEAQGLKVAP